ncbi:hypothetical protein [Parapedobacter sp. 10938]|uniref:hypothetical protein n=1 Tax=Parapedobacter flavus TaxID=3110225 RepID=UPI002DB5EEDD|nr:hypothetical protein [Parapedobacter sp. 10938]MEC3881305.1 hypothetical protein [Parapedobacter sp. 10938]
MNVQSRMKQATFLVLSLGLVLFISCSKDKNDEPEPEFENKKGVTATITYEDGNTAKYAGAVKVAVWSKDDDGNILSIIAVDENYKDAVLTFGISHADGKGSYSLDPNELMANPAKLLWPDMAYDNWPGFVTGDANGDQVSDGTGTFEITTLTDKETKGTFSMVMGNDLGESITVKGEFNCPVMRVIE